MKLDKELTYNQPEVDILNGFKEIDKSIAKSNDNFELLKKLSEEAHVKYPNSPLGGFFNLNVADGRVQYQITEIKGNTAYAKLCHGICLDMYQDDILGDGDWISLKKATELVNGQIAMAKLFRR